MAIILDTALDVWRKDFGDPDALSWLITGAYLLAAVLCARAALAARNIPWGETVPERPRNWWVLAAGMLGLGLNKQLDLQIFVREFGLAFAASIGLEKQRKWIGRTFVCVLAVFLIRVLAGAAREMRRSTRGHRLLLTGLALLACFAVVRAGTYVPYLKEVNFRYGKALHFIFELGGIVLVGLSAWRTRYRLVRHQSSSMSNA